MRRLPTRAAHRIQHPQAASLVYRQGGHRSRVLLIGGIGEAAIAGCDDPRRAFHFNGIEQR